MPLYLLTKYTLFAYFMRLFGGMHLHVYIFAFLWRGMYSHLSHTSPHTDTHRHTKVTWNGAVVDQRRMKQPEAAMVLEFFFYCFY